jgi:hypothetical protein
MTIWERAKVLMLKPHATWTIIKEESGDMKQLFLNYAAPLALIPSVSSLIGITLVGFRAANGVYMRAPFWEALVGSIIGYFFHLLGIGAGIWAVKIMAPYFNSRLDIFSAAKLVIYALTPMWLTGVFAIFPGTGYLSILGLYAVYLLWLGVPSVMETPPRKIMWFTVSILTAGLFINLLLSIIVVGMIYGPMYMRMMAL